MLAPVTGGRAAVAVRRRVQCADRCQLWCSQRLLASAGRSCQGRSSSPGRELSGGERREGPAACWSSSRSASQWMSATTAARDQFTGPAAAAARISRCRHAPHAAPNTCAFRAARAGRMPPARACSRARPELQPAGIWLTGTPYCVSWMSSREREEHGHMGGRTPCCVQDNCRLGRPKPRIAGGTEARQPARPPAGPECAAAACTGAQQPPVPSDPRLPLGPPGACGQTLAAAPAKVTPASRPYMHAGKLAGGWEPIGRAAHTARPARSAGALHGPPARRPTERRRAAAPAVVGAPPHDSCPAPTLLLPSSIGDAGGRAARANRARCCVCLLCTLIWSVPSPGPLLSSAPCPRHTWQG